MPPQQREGLEQLLDGLARMGFVGASRRSREQLLRNLTTLGPAAVAGGQALMALGLFLSYGLPDPQTGHNAFWQTFGYPGPSGVPEAGPRAVTPLVPEGEEAAYEADAVIVGTGAGGGVIAAALARAGQRVLLLDMGGLFDESDFNQYELWAYQNLYWRGGPNPTADMNVSLYAGTSFGGGTTINWTNCLRTKPWVREQWAREHGLEGLDTAEFDRHLDAVWERLGVNDRCSHLNGTQESMKRGAEALGWSFKAVTRNVDESRYTPETAGYIGFGDQTGAKQSTAKTYLADALAAGRRGDRALLRRARPRRGRPRRRGGGGLQRPADGAQRARHSARAARRRGRRGARVAGAAAALGDRRARGGREPATPSLHGHHRQLPRGPARLVGRAACGARRRVREPRRRPRLPDRGDPVRARHGRLGHAVRGRRDAQEPHAADALRSDLHRPRARPRQRPRDDRRGRPGRCPGTRSTIPST